MWNLRQSDYPSFFIRTTIFPHNPAHFRIAVLSSAKLFVSFIILDYNTQIWPHHWHSVADIDFNFIHWMVINVPDDDIDQGDTLVEYRDPDKTGLDIVTPRGTSKQHLFTQFF